jgi:preprotein translocase subunit SecA
MHDAYRIKTATLDQTKLEDYLSKAYLRVMDKHWMTHIDDMQHLREKVSLFGYAQIDPLVMYKKEAYEKFESLQFLIKQEIVSLVLKTDYTQAL